MLLVMMLFQEIQLVSEIENASGNNVEYKGMNVCCSQDRLEHHLTIWKRGEHPRLHVKIIAHGLASKHQTRQPSLVSFLGSFLEMSRQNLSSKLL
jgi:hypothetical protein